jgi:hypothetical protein
MFQRGARRLLIRPLRCAMSSHVCGGGSVSACVAEDARFFLFGHVPSEVALWKLPPETR